MITMYTGTPGSGKSLYLCHIVFANLKRGVDVICNFPVKFTEKEKQRGLDQHFSYWTNSDISVATLVQAAFDRKYIQSKKEHQCMIIVDEAGGRFNARDFKVGERMEWIDFLSQHRKMGYDMILVAQSPRMIDLQIRGFVETEKVFRKLNNYGPFALLWFPVFVCVEKWYVTKERVGASFFLYHKKWGNRYDSMKLFDGFRMNLDAVKKDLNINNAKKVDKKPELNKKNEVDNLINDYNKLFNPQKIEK